MFTPENGPPVPSSFRGTTHLGEKTISNLTMSDEALKTEALQMLKDVVNPLPTSLQLAIIVWIGTILKLKDKLQ